MEIKKILSRANYLILISVLFALISCSNTEDEQINNSENIQGPPTGNLDLSKEYSAVFDTEVGEFIIKLYDDKAPYTVENFINLANSDYYDKTTFHRVLPNFINNIVNDNKLLVYGSGKQTRTYCYISDAINGILRIMKYGKSGEIYNIGNSKPEISVLDLTKKLSKLSSKKIEYKIINYPSSYPEDEPQRRCPDLSKAKKHLNFNPNISIEEGLRKYLQWGLENY